MARRFSSFEEFWPYYLAQHRHPVCRGLHLAGTLAALACLGLGLMASPYWLLAAPVSSYGLAWLGHMAFERNRPATFGHPLWSLRGDIRMVARMLSGRRGPGAKRLSRPPGAPREGGGRHRPPAASDRS